MLASEARSAVGLGNANSVIARASFSPVPLGQSRKLSCGNFSQQGCRHPSPTSHQPFWGIVEVCWVFLVVARPARFSSTIGPSPCPHDLCLISESICYAPHQHKEWNAASKSIVSPILPPYHYKINTHGPAKPLFGYLISFFVQF